MTFPIYLDEHIDPRLVSLLAEIGCDALTAREAGRANRGISDPDQLQFAADEGRAIVTYNGRDFLPLAIEWSLQGKPHAGIVIARERPPKELARRFKTFFELYSSGISNQALWLPRLQAE